jgi:hypothetical protein
MGINPNTHLQIELNLGFQMACVTEIVRKEKTGTGIYYGAKYISTPVENRNALRGFILKNQVETYFVTKRKETHERATQGKRSVANS